MNYVRVVIATLSGVLMHLYLKLRAATRDPSHVVDSEPYYSQIHGTIPCTARTSVPSKEGVVITTLRPMESTISLTYCEAYTERRSLADPLLPEHDDYI